MVVSVPILAARAGLPVYIPISAESRTPVCPRLLHYGVETFCNTRINNLSEASIYSLA
jgi:hypothetical protein